MTGDMTMPPRGPSDGHQNTTRTSAITMPEVEYTPIQTFLRDLKVPLNQRGLKQAIAESSLNGDGTLSHEDLVAFARWISGESALVVENAEKSIEEFASPKYINSFLLFDSSGAYLKIATPLRFDLASNCVFKLSRTVLTTDPTAI